MPLADKTWSTNSPSELDGTEDDPICICGFSVKFPQDATSAEGFWNMMVEKRCAMTTFPPNRINLKGFHRKDNRGNTVSFIDSHTFRRDSGTFADSHQIPIKGGHFIKDDLSVSFRSTGSGEVS